MVEFILHCNILVLGMLVIKCLELGFYCGLSSLCLQALVDAPDMVRTQMNFKRLSLTDLKVDIKRVPKKKDLLQAMEAAGGRTIDVLPYNVIYGCLICLIITIVIIFRYQEVGEFILGKETHCSEEEGCTH